MRQINKTIYVLNDDYYIHCENEALVFRKKNEEICRIPSLGIEQIIIFGNTTVSSYLIGYCCKHNILLSYVTKYGNYQGSFYGEMNGNVLLRKKQYSLFNTDQERQIAKNIVLGKAINSRHTLLRAAKNAKEEEKSAINIACDKIRELIEKVIMADSISSIRGLEGVIADIYFAQFDKMIKTNDSTMLFVKRSRKPPLNNCNAALSLLYTLATLNCVSAIECAGLDSEFGFLHALRSGRHSLACDLVEEFRSCMVDRYVIKMINLRKITSNDFENDGSGIRFKEKKLNEFLNEWEDYKSQELEHPLYKKKIQIKAIPYIQAQLLAENIRGDISEYPPIEWR